LLLTSGPRSLRGLDRIECGPDGKAYFPERLALSLKLASSKLRKKF